MCTYMYVGVYIYIYTCKFTSKFIYTYIHIYGPGPIVYIYAYVWTYSGTESYECLFFSEKGQRNVEKGQNIEYWKIWAKMKKI